MFSLRVIGDEGQVKIRWKNGDVLPGRILQSQNPVLHFSSEIFQNNPAISTSELEKYLHQRLTRPKKGSRR